MGPFDRFNDRAKRVLALSQDEAIRFNHNYIGVEHLLLGLIREGEGVAAQVLNSLGVDLSTGRKSVETIIGRGDTTTPPSSSVLSPRTKRCSSWRSTRPASSATGMSARSTCCSGS